MPSKEDFIGIFKAESEEHLTKLNNGIVELEKNPGNLELIKELNRAAHTLKGSARIFGYYELQEIAHKIEDIFDKIQQKKIVFSSSSANRIFKALDAIKIILGKIVNHETINLDISEICSELAKCVAVNTDSPPLPPHAADLKPQEDTKISNKTESHDGNITVPASRITVHEPKTAAQESKPVTEEYIRVPISKVNKLLNLVGEVVINKMKSSQEVSRIKKFTKHTREIQKRLAELNEKIKKHIPANDLEINRISGQCNAEAQKLRDESLSLYDNVSTESFYLDPVITELQDRMKEIRMLPCSTIFEGFPRMIRDIAAQEGKEINFLISGEETELDKKVLEGIKTALMHILRNCVDHGIEKPAKRESIGKPRGGTISLSAYHEAGNVVIVIEDDGKGINVEEIKQTALRKHLIAPEELKSMTEREILNIVFMNGYSTSPIITDVSGRGIGLDVVRHNIENLKGQVILETEEGKWSKFTLILPLTIAIIKVLLVKANNMTFAIPIPSIAECLRIDSKDISTIEGRMAIQVREHTVPIVRLENTLNLPATQDDSSTDRANVKEIPIVIASSLEKQVGFIVDDIVSEEEIYIKTLGAHLGKVKNTAGAAIMGQGDVVIVLDVVDLITSSRLSHPAVTGRAPIIPAKREQKRLLVVEDALSTRELEKNILETQGYSVDTAVDGLDGLGKITQNRYDLIVTDVQMPRMDGFEFCRTLKGNPSYKDIPVIIVTALEKEEEKRYGVEVGASAYIIKSTFEQTNLIDAIERLIG